MLTDTFDSIVSSDVTFPIIETKEGSTNAFIIFRMNRNVEISFNKPNVHKVIRFIVAYLI